MISTFALTFFIRTRAYVERAMRLTLRCELTRHYSKSVLLGYLEEVVSSVRNGHHASG